MVRLHVPFMQRDVADACGLSIVQVNRTIQELRRAKLIEGNGRAVDFLQRDQFELLGELRPHISCADFFGRRFVLFLQANQQAYASSDPYRRYSTCSRVRPAVVVEPLERGHSVRDLPEVTVAKLRRCSDPCGGTEHPRW